MERPLERKNDSLHKGKPEEYVEVWEDIVSIKDLIKALAICAITTLGAYFIAPNEPPQPLFYGLGGSLIGFILCSFIIKPKRIFKQQSEDKA